MHLVGEYEHKGHRQWTPKGNNMTSIYFLKSAELDRSYQNRNVERVEVKTLLTGKNQLAFTSSKATIFVGIR